MAHVGTTSAHDRLEAAESILSILCRVDAASFPWTEKLALAVAKMRAAADWNDAARSVTSQAKAAHKSQPASKATGQPSAQTLASVAPDTSLSSFLVDRGHPDRL